MRTLLRISTVIAMPLLVGVVAACGGRDEPRSPEVVGLSSVQLDQDTTSAPIAFRILDRDTAPELLVVTLGSSNEALLPRSAIVLGGSGEARTLTLTPTPEATGESTVTVQVRDEAGLVASGTLLVRVAPVLRSFRALAVEVFAVGEADTPVPLRGFTLQPDADDDPAAFEVLLQ